MKEITFVRAVFKVADNEQGFVSVQEFEKQMFKQLMQPNKDKMMKLRTSSLYCTKPLVVGSASRQKIKFWEDL